MDDFRSKSCNNGTSQFDNTYNSYGSNRFNATDNNNGLSSSPNYKSSSTPPGMQDLRCYSTSYASSSAHNGNGNLDIVVAEGGAGRDQWKIKKGKSINGVVSKSWSFSDPELKRKKRIASYKAYTVEGKVKGSIKKSFRWIKERCSLMIHGHR